MVVSNGTVPNRDTVRDEESKPKNNTSEKGKDEEKKKPTFIQRMKEKVGSIKAMLKSKEDKKSTVTVSSSGIVAGASPADPDAVGDVPIEERDETSADSSVTNTGAGGAKRKVSKVLKMALVGAAAVVLGTIAVVGVLLGESNKDNAGLREEIAATEVEKDDALSGKEEAENNNQQTITEFYNTVAQNVDKAVADYNDAKGAFNAIGKNPGDPNFDAIAEANGVLQDKYDSLAALQAEFEVYATQYKNGELSDKAYREILTQLNNQANQVINEADNLENLCANYSVYSVTVDQSALSKDKVQKLLGDKTIVGKVTGVESCKYWSDTGKVQIVVKIQEAERPGVTAKEYIRVIEADVTPGQKTTSFKIITDELAGNKTVEARTYECGQQSDMGANANSNIKVGYSQSAKRDPKTGLITSEAGAVVMIYDDTGALVDIEVFSADSQTDAKDHTPEMREQLKEETQEYIKSLQLQGMKVVGKIDNYFLLVQDDERGM